MHRADQGDTQPLAYGGALGAVFLHYTVRLRRSYRDDMARRTFHFSIIYLSALFAALLVNSNFPS